MKTKKAAEDPKYPQKTKTWHTLLVYPPSYLGKGVARAVAMMEAHPVIAFYSTDRAEVVRKSQERPYCDLVFHSDEQSWDRAAFRIRETCKVDPAVMERFLTGGRA